MNTPRLITDANSNIVWRWDDTEPFGNNIPNQSPNGGNAFVYNPRFSGQYYDQETGTVYNYFRDYDPTTGRYMESDPLGLFGAQFSTYGYVGGNPIRFSDPEGLIAGVDDAVIIGGVIVTGAILSSPLGQKATKSIASKIEALCKPDPKTPCEQQQEDDEEDCAHRYGRFFGWASPAYRGCMQRASINADLCRRSLPQLPKWSDSDVTGEPPQPPRKSK